MFFMYVDESGDFGVTKSPTPIVVLTGIVVHESRWRPCLNKILEFRRSIKQGFGLPIREEIHAAALIGKPGPYIKIPKHLRLAIIREFADVIATMQDISIINVVVDKTKRSSSQEVFETAWETLLQRFENTLTHCNFPNARQAGPSGAHGLVIADNTDNKRLRGLLRRMRQYNPVPHYQAQFGTGARNLPLAHIVEDPVFRDSTHSYLLQAADTVAYLAYQHLHPNHYMKEKAGHNYLKRLLPVICRVASSGDPLGIVRR